jgi:1,4-dihydroxy-2-naphthoyl-CoA hydrolase
MYIYHTQVRLKDTDATGVLYFTEQFRMALEAFEEFLKDRGFPLKQLLESSYLMPIVHAEADYFAPLTVGDALEISLKVVKLGTSSVTLEFSFRSPECKFEIGKVQIVHVVIEKEKRNSVPIPDFFRTILESEINVVSEAVLKLEKHAF